MHWALGNILYARLDKDGSSESEVQSVFGIAGPNEGGTEDFVWSWPLLWTYRVYA